MFTFDIAKKRAARLFFTVCPVGQLPLRALMLPLAIVSHAGATTLPLDEEGVPEGGGRYMLRATITH